MPFSNMSQGKKIDAQSSKLENVTQKIIGRDNELNFFIQHILKPDEPSSNIIPISGNKGVGKTTLLKGFVEETCNSSFIGYCIPTLVDQPQAAPIDIMGAFAKQLRQAGYPITKFEDELNRHKGNRDNQEQERDAAWEAFGSKMVKDAANQAFKDVPVVNNLLGDEIEPLMEAISTEQHYQRSIEGVSRQEDPEGFLTEVFVAELNTLTTTLISHTSNVGIKYWWRIRRFFNSFRQHIPFFNKRRVREFRVILMLDTVEQLAPEAATWLLNHFLKNTINSNVVLIIAGNDPISYFSSGDPQQWLEYYDRKEIHPILLKNFNKEETHNYLAKLNITNTNQIEKIWQLSGGLPHHLSLLTSNRHHEVNPDLDIIANFLSWLPLVKKQLVLSASLLSKPFDLNDLTAFTCMPQIQNEQEILYLWLVGQPFIHPLGDRYTYHELAREEFSSYYYQNLQSEYFTIRKNLATYYWRFLENIQGEWGKDVYHLTKWPELTMALAYQLLLLPDQASIDKGIEQVLNADNHMKQNGELVNFLNDLSQEQSLVNVETHVCQATKHLMKYIDDKSESQSFLASAAYLLGRAANTKSFSVEVLTRVYGKRGFKYLKLKEYQQALRDFDRMIELTPDHPMAYFGRGVVYLRMENFREAIKEFDQTTNLKLSKNQLLITHNLKSVCLAAIEEYWQAINAISHVIKLVPENVESYNTRAKLYTKLKEYHQAIADINRAIDINSEGAILYSNRSLVYKHLRDYEHAIADLDTAIKLKPKNISFYSKRAILYHLMGNYEKALADIDYAIALDKNNIGALSNERGLLLSYLGRYSEAIENYERNLQINPKSHSSIYNVAVVMVRWKGFPEANIYVDQTRTFFENEEVVNEGVRLYGLGGLEALVGNIDQALNYLQQSLSLEDQAIDWALHDIAWIELRADSRFQKIISTQV